MRPKTRGVKASKVCKENINTRSKANVKTAGLALKATRKPLADKTNSASDENASPEQLKKVIKKSCRPSRKVAEAVEVERPRRNRRLPTRYVENQVLNNLSNSKENAAPPSKPIAKTHLKDDSKAESPFRTPNSTLDSSLRASRPRRLGRLPSKFDENSMSPKFLPIQPCHTSTPLVLKAKEPKSVYNKHIISDTVTLQKVSRKVTPQKATSVKAAHPKVTPRKVTPQNTTSEDKSQKAVQKKLNKVKVNADTDSNGRQQCVRRLRKPVEYKEVTLSPKIKSPEISSTKRVTGTKISSLNSSFKVLEEKKNKNTDNQDIYEFTFDPAEEPQPQKKKRKNVPAKKPAKPKTRVYNNNYEKNIARALADLKNVVSKQKPENIKASSNGARSQLPTGQNNEVQPIASTGLQTTATCKPATPKLSAVVISTTADIHSSPVINNSVRSNTSTKNHASIRVEDIAAVFEATMDHDDINYSPVNSPHQADIIHHPTSPERDAPRSDDPLNLRNDLSFFDEQPVASSSINMSTRNPMSTPWRVEFGNLPIKWQANTYVKPDMTPALESSYINNFDDSKKKHVYTNMVAQEYESLQEMEQNEAPKLKQTSIISFIKEVVEKSANKKNKRGAGTPKKANSLFDDPNISIDPTNNQTATSVAAPLEETSGSSNKDISSDTNVSTESKKSQKRKHDGDLNPTSAKISRKENNNTLFGFDDSENQEQENVSPVKVVNTKRLRSLRSRAVLQELNKQTGPMRADLPAAMKSKLAPSSDVVEKIYDQIKSATDAPVLLDDPVDGETTNVVEMPDGARGEEDGQSVHLFEDIELVHHFKPTRKSYGKPKKVTFDQHSSDSGDEAPPRNLSSDDDADDLSFHLPEFKTKKVTKKKKSKKQLLSKKEKAEVDAWAACFNSMCEDIEEFDLVVE